MSGGLHATYAWQKARKNRLAIARANGEHCVRCQQPIDYTLSGNAKHGPTIDHLDPLSAGGDLVPPPDMLAPAHKSCNSRHGQAVAESKRAAGGRYSGEKVIRARSSRSVTEKQDQLRAGEAVILPSPAPSPRPNQGRLALAATVVVPFTKSNRPRPSNAGLPLRFPDPHPQAVGSYGDDAVEWIEKRMASDRNAEGSSLLWWQWLVLQRSLEHRADGSLCWPLALLKVMRQQGKSVLLCELAMWRAAHAHLFGEVQKVLHAARVAALADQQQSSARLWAETNGLGGSKRKADSFIEWPDGSHWHVMAMGAVWGQRVGLALLDEGWDLPQQAFWSGLWPAMAQRKSRQAWVFSASNEGDRGLMASLEATEGCCVMVWGAPEDADFADESLWHAVTPHMTDERLEAMRVAVSAPGFKTEWLNVQPVGSGVQDWLPGWADLGASQGDSGSGIGAVEVSSDRSAYGTAVACRREDGTLDVWTASHPDLDAACAWLSERHPVVVLAGLSVKEQVLVPSEVQGVGVRETRFATPVLLEMVRNRRLRHDHGTAMADQVSWGRVTATEYGDVLSAKASDGPIPTAKAVAWSTWAAASGAVASEAPAIF